MYIRMYDFLISYICMGNRQKRSARIARHDTRGGKFSRHGLKVTSVVFSCCGCFQAAVDGRSEIVLTGVSSVALVHRRSSEANRFR